MPVYTQQAKLQIQFAAHKVGIIQFTGIFLFCILTYHRLFFYKLKHRLPSIRHSAYFEDINPRL